MKILLENDKGYVIVDDSTGKIISVVVHNAVEGKRDFVNLASFKNNTDGTQTAIRFCANHQRDLDWNEEETNKRMDIIGQNGNTGEHYELLDSIETNQVNPNKMTLSEMMWGGNYKDATITITQIMDENKWHNRIMHLTSFSLGIVVTALMMAKGWFDELLYVILGSVLILLASFVYHYIRGIDYMTQNHPDYTGDDLFEEEDNTWERDK
jgi:hypothetical protein